MEAALDVSPAQDAEIEEDHARRHGEALDVVRGLHEPGEDDGDLVGADVLRVQADRCWERDPSPLGHAESPSRARTAVGEPEA